jgi:hypothetical protein
MPFRTVLKKVSQVVDVPVGPGISGVSGIFNNRVAAV